MRTSIYRTVQIAIACGLFMRTAQGLSYLDTDDQLLAATIPPTVVEKLSKQQIADLKIALELMSVPAVPEELTRILTIAGQSAHADSAARAHIDALAAETSRWTDLGRASPEDMHGFISLAYLQNTLPVIVKLVQLNGKLDPINSVIKQAKDVAKTPYSMQALRVRKDYADLTVEEKSKADGNVPGAREILLVLTSQTADAAAAQLTKPSQGESSMPSCDSITWLPAFESEAGARYTKANGWEKPEVPCK